MEWHRKPIVKRLDFNQYESTIIIKLITGDVANGGIFRYLLLYNDTVKILTFDCIYDEIIMEMGLNLILFLHITLNIGMKIPIDESSYQ